MPTLKRHTGSAFEYIGLPVNIGMSPQTLGYAEVTANQGSITTEVDLTGLAVNVIVPAGRRIRITASAPGSSTVVGDTGRLTIKDELNNNLQSCRVTYSVAARSETHVATVVISPSAGTHTYRLAMARSAGTGTLTMGASSGEPAFILVEDVTGSTLPYQPASVPVGSLGYSSFSGSQTFTSEVALTNYSVNVAVPAGRQLRITAVGHVFSAGTAGQAAVFRIKDNGVEVGGAQVTGIINPTTSERWEAAVLHSPTAGSHTYTVTAQRNGGADTLTNRGGGTEQAYLLVEDITPTPAPSSGAPGSTLGYAEVTANQSPITTEVDVTGLSVTVTVPDGRRIRISSALGITSTVNDDIGFMRIAEGGTNLAFAQAKLNTNTESVFASIVLTPTAGSHTYKIRAARTSGTGNLTVGAASTNPAYILVEDITGSVWPEGSEVTAGMVASEAWIDYVPTLTQGVTLSKTLTYAKYQRIGRTIYVQVSLTITSAGTSGQAIEIGVPVPTVTGSPMAGSFRYVDSGVGVYVGTTIGWSTSVVRLSVAPDNLGSNPSLAAANTDQLQIAITYEAAS